MVPELNFESTLFHHFWISIILHLLSIWRLFRNQAFGAGGGVFVVACVLWKSGFFRVGWNGMRRSSLLSKKDSIIYFKIKIMFFRLKEPLSSNANIIFLSTVIRGLHSAWLFHSTMHLMKIWMYFDYAISYCLYFIFHRKKHNCIWQWKEYVVFPIPEKKKPRSLFHKF